MIPSGTAAPANTGPAITLPDPREHSTYIGMFVCGMALPLDNLGIAGYPINTLAALLIVLITFFTNPTGTHRLVPAWVLAVAAIAPVWLAVSAWQNDQWVFTRLGTAIAWAGLIFVVATGRAHAPSLARGALTGLGLAVVAFYLGIAPNSYEWRLTSWISDPNGVAMTVLSLGLASMVWATRKRNVQLALVVFLALMTLATLSRTGIFALGLAVAWMAVLRKQNLIGAALLAGLTAYIFENVPDSIKYWGPFAERGGSDDLRERILAVENQMVQTHQWLGYGPGTAKVDVSGIELFFHSSYLSARVEGGWIFLGLILLAAAGAFVMLGSGAKRPERAWLQAAIIGLLVTSTNIGEALLTPAAALTIGLALGWLSSRAVADVESKSQPPATAPEPL